MTKQSTDTADVFVAYANFQRVVEYNRNVAYGGGAACLAILLALLPVIPVNAVTGALSVTVWGAAIGVPAFVGLAIMFEVYATLGDDRSGKHYREVASRWWLPLPAVIAVGGLTVAVGGLVWHIDERIGVAFGITIVVYLVWAIGLSLVLGRWLTRRHARDAKKPDGPSGL
jgi:hypothetical protein